MSKRAQMIVMCLLIIIVFVLLVCAILIPSEKYVDELYEIGMTKAATCFTVISALFVATLVGITAGAVVLSYVWIYDDD